MKTSRAMADELTAETEDTSRPLDREYVLVVAPDRLDAGTAPPFVDRLWEQGVHCDLIVDAAAVEHCEPGVVDLIDRAAELLAAEDVRVVISQPSPAVEAALGGNGRQTRFSVRRPT